MDRQEYLLHVTNKLFDAAFEILKDNINREDTFQGIFDSVSNIYSKSIVEATLLLEQLEAGAEER